MALADQIEEQPQSRFAALDQLEPVAGDFGADRRPGSTSSEGWSAIAAVVTDFQGRVTETNINVDLVVELATVVFELLGADS